jgi:hypothetical protein
MVTLLLHTQLDVLKNGSGKRNGKGSSSQQQGTKNWPKPTKEPLTLQKFWKNNFLKKHMVVSPQIRCKVFKKSLSLHIKSHNMGSTKLPIHDVLCSTTHMVINLMEFHLFSKRCITCNMAWYPRICTTINHPSLQKLLWHNF